jgi:seryl-tRNA synthetase
MNIRIALLGIVALTAITSPALAQTQRSGGADARVMQQLQQLTTERTALQAENSKLKQDLERAQEELKKATAGKTAAESRTRTLEAAAGRGEASAQQSTQELERTRAQMQELIGKFRETAQTLRDVESDRTQAKSQLAARERDFKTCVDRNAGLYNLNSEVLDHMANRGFWSSLGEREPFTKLKRVELENLIDDYKYRAEELKLEQSRAEARPTAKN